MGRPRIEVDFAIVLRMREKQNLGWSRMAELYRELTGQHINRDTIKRRYYEVVQKRIGQNRLAIEANNNTQRDK